MEQGIVLLVVGMGVVFGFLVLLVFSVQVMGNVLSHIAPPEPEPQPSQLKKSTPDSTLIVAVAAAKRYRSGK